MASKLRACKNCKRLIEDVKLVACPHCKSNVLTEKYKGRIVVVNAKDSKIAQKISIEDNGDYALKL